MDLHKRISIFVQLGKFVNDYVTFSDEITTEPIREILDDAILQSRNNNPWFDEVSQLQALKAISGMLRQEALTEWMAAYPETKLSVNNPKTIALIMAGNIPLVGFHDVLSVLISGNKALVKLSSDDRFLLPALLKIATTIDKRISEHISFTDKVISGFDAVIATGSNNSARSFNYYFSRFPHIIRKNRNAVAILTGNESFTQLQALSHDVFDYYGLGCRNVTKIYVPESYDFKPLLDNWMSWRELQNHTRYFNNYEYNKAVFLVNKVPHFDTGFVLLTQSTEIASSVAVVLYDYYQDQDRLLSELQAREEQIQCIIGDKDIFTDFIDFGHAQKPELSDYADGVDTISFLLQLNVEVNGGY